MPSSDQTNPIDTSLLARSILGVRDRALIEKAAKLLVGIQSPLFEQHTRNAHYTTEEHAEGWRRHRKACGNDTPLESYFLRQTSNTISPRDMELLGKLDVFENRWFPLTRRIIQREVDAMNRDAFEAAFFLELEQQPLGPGVLTSVPQYLERVAGLESSDQPGAEAVRATLIKRGLDDAEVTRVRGLIKTAEEGQLGKKLDIEAVQRVMAARDAQLQGVDQLRTWYNEWATAFRGFITNANHLLLLGLGTYSATESEPEAPAAVIETPVVAEPAKAPAAPGLPGSNPFTG